jgi:FMN-dependent NADH-azoreductase
MIAAKFAVLRAQTATEEQHVRWQRAVHIARRFNAADKDVFTCRCGTSALHTG